MSLGSNPYEEPSWLVDEDQNIRLPHVSDRAHRLFGTRDQEMYRCCKLIREMEEQVGRKLPVSPQGIPWAFDSALLRPETVYGDHEATEGAARRIMRVIAENPNCRPSDDLNPYNCFVIECFFALLSGSRCHVTGLPLHPDTRCVGGVTYAHRTHGVWITTGFTCPRPRRVAHWYQSKCNIIPESSTASQLHHNISRAKLEALFKDVTIPYAKSRNPWMADKEDWKLHLFDDDVDQDPGARCGSVARANKDIPTTTPSNKDAIHHDESSKDQDMGAASKSGISGSKAAGSDEPTTTGKGKAGPPSQNDSEAISCAPGSARSRVATPTPKTIDISGSSSVELPDLDKFKNLTVDSSFDVDEDEDALPGKPVTGSHK